MYNIEKIWAMQSGCLLLVHVFIAAQQSCIILLNKSFCSVVSTEYFLCCCAGHHFICIQSMDGMLMFFEQETYAFGRFLPGFLLPGPLSYCIRTDSFITVSSTRQVECYRWDQFTPWSIVHIVTGHILPYADTFLLNVQDMWVFCTFTFVLFLGHVFK